MDSGWAPLSSCGCQRRGRQSRGRPGRLRSCLSSNRAGKGSRYRNHGSLLSWSRAGWAGVWRSGSWSEPGWAVQPQIRTHRRWKIPPSVVSGEVAAAPVGPGQPAAGCRRGHLQGQGPSSCRKRWSHERSPRSKRPPVPLQGWHPSSQPADHRLGWPDSWCWSSVSAGWRRATGRGRPSSSGRTPGSGCGCSGRLRSSTAVTGTADREW